MDFTFFLSEQIERLTWQNEEFEENLENLESMIKEKIALLGFQEAKFCEMENNKEKLGAAEKRLELLKQCSDRISNHLLLSELLWLSMNTEKEAVENILENVATAHYEQEIEQCARNSVCITTETEILVRHFINDITGESRENVFQLFGRSCGRRVFGTSC